MNTTDVSEALWRKSSYSSSNANCVEVAVWRKSHYSNGQASCVEVKSDLPGLIAVRDSKDPEGAALAFRPGQWEAFTRCVKARRGARV